MLRRPRLVFLALLTLCSSPSRAFPADPTPAPPAPRVKTTVMQLADPQGDSLLVVPESCNARACPLLLVSHPYGATPSYGLDFAGHATYAGFLERFLRADYALLLSLDGGKETWGNDLALEYGVRVWNRAQTLFNYSGETFTLGLSMGALPATLLGLTGRLPVKAGVLIAGVLSPPALYRGKNPAYPGSIARAYGLPEKGATDAQLAFALTPHDPVQGTLFFRRPDIPFLAVASSEDTGVKLEQHSAAFIKSVQPFSPQSALLEVKGPHLSAPHFSEAVVNAALEFLARFRSR